MVKERVRMKSNNIQSIYRLSYMQEGMLYHSQLNNDTTQYVIQEVIKINERISINSMRESLRLLLLKYDVLRTAIVIPKTDDRPLQVVLNERDVELNVIDLINTGQQDRAAEIERIKKEDIVRGFNLQKDCLLRITLVLLAPDESVALWSSHHIIMDGWCNSLLLRDFMTYYSRLETGVTFDKLMKEVLKEKGEIASYQEYIEWLEKQNVTEGLAYWKDLLKGYSGTSMIKSCDNANRSEGEICSLSFEVSSGKTKEIQSFITAHQITMNTLLETTWGMLLQKYNRCTDVVFGKVVSGRNAEIKGIEQAVGLFINTIPVRIHCEEDKNLTCLEMLKEVQQQAVNSSSYDFCPLAEIQSKTKSGSSLINNLMVFENYYVDENADKDGFKYEMLAAREETNYPLVCNAFMDNLLHFKITFSSSVYTQREMELFLKHLYQALCFIVDNPNECIINICITDDEEKELLIHGLNDTEADYPASMTIVDLFGKQVGKTPDNISISYEDKQITYDELNKMSNQVAHKLRSMGVGRGDLVALLTERSIEQLIGIYAVIKAGAAYVPINPDYPVERIEYTLQDSKPKIILVGNQPACINSDTPVINMFDPNLYTGNSSNPDHVNYPEDLIYIIYTSGTTGRPKGVMIEHKNVVRLLKNSRFQFQFNEKDIWAMFHNSCFDFSVWEIFGASLYSGKLVIVPEETMRDAVSLSRFIEKYRITVLNQVPSAFYSLLKADLDSGENRMDSLRYLIFGGEALNPSKLIEWKQKYPSAETVNMYGITETTVHVTYRKIGYREASNDASDIGRPIPTLQVFLMNGNQLCGIGIPGEICVAGEGVARGYLNLPKLTAQRFVKNPFGKGNMYRSGDLARWRADRNLEYLGRIDDQVQIRGFRIELGEIEHVIRSSQLVDDVAVITKTDNDENAYIAVYYTSKNEIAYEHMRQLITASLPEYMMPSYFLKIDSMPITENGKLDKKALPDIEIADRKNYAAPRTRMEEAIAGIYSEVLNVSKVGVHDSFFELGGHSLRATRVMNRIESVTGVKLQLKEIFTHPTVEALARRTEEGRREDYSPILEAEIQESYPMSSAQKRLYLINEIDGGRSTAYNMPAAIEVEGSLKLSRVRLAFQKLVDRHEALRTSFFMKGEEGYQLINPALEVDIEVEQSVQTETASVFSTFIRPFDLASAPLIRLKVLEIGPEKYVLMFDMHHIISDGMSMNILVSDFSRLYAGEELKPLRIQYKDYSKWMSGRDLNEQEAYWKKEFQDGIPVLEMPLDYARPQVQNYAGGYVLGRLEPELRKKLREFCSREGATDYMVMLSAYMVMLAGYSRQEEIVVGSPISGRIHRDTEGIVGMFVNTLAVKGRPCSNKSFLSFLREMKETCLKAYENQEYPFEDLVELVGAVRDVSRNPLFDVMFILQNNEQVEFYADDLKFKQTEGEHEVSKLDLTLSIAEDNDGYMAALEYGKSLFKKESVEYMMRHFIAVLQEAVENPEREIGRISMMDCREREFLDAVNDTQEQWPRDKTIPELFRKQALKTPHRTAVIFHDREMTYQELDQRSDRLAARLIGLSVGPDDRVAVISERSELILVAMLAVNKAGGAYVPIDPGMPEARIEYMLEDAGCRYALTYGEKPAGGCVQKLKLDDESNYPVTNLKPENRNSPEDLCYVIYTSGSTGKPKGTMLTHSSVTNYCTRNQRNVLGGMIGDGCTRIVSVTTLAFDIFVTETLLPLVNGMTVVMADETEQENLSFFGELVRKHDIEVLQTTPSRMRLYLGGMGDKGCLNLLKVILLGGEKVEAGLIDELRQYTGAELVNVYGPTETTVWSTACRLEKGTEITVGRPIANTEIYIKDRERLCGIGMPGELCIGGEGLARGYLNLPDLTAEKFIDNPFGDGRIYCTGDLARWRPDGRIEYMGRMDEQVKIRGFRIELGEIEAVLRKIDTIRDAAVIVRNDKNGAPAICAYFVSDEPLNQKDIRTKIQKELPEYMMPAFLMQIDLIPINNNGKVDKKSLPEITIKGQKDYLVPRTENEKKVSAIYREVLGIDNVGVSDSFFELGGHSLKAVTVINRIMENSPIKLMLHDIFLHPTVHDLSLLIERKELELVKEKDTDFVGMLTNKFSLTDSDILKLSIGENYILFIKEQLLENHSKEIAGLLTGQPLLALPSYLFPIDCIKIIGQSDKYEIDAIAETIKLHYYQNINVKQIISSLDNEVNQYAKIILQSVMIKEHELAPIQKFSAKLRILNNMIEMDFFEPVNRKRLDDIWNSFVLINPYLRSAVHLPISKIQEYQVTGRLRIPFIDMTYMIKKHQDSIIKKVMEYFWSFENLNNYAGNFLTNLPVLVKVHECHYKLILPCTHMVFDGYSSEFLKNQISSLYHEQSVIKDLIEDCNYSQFLELIKTGPLQISEQKIIEKLDLIQFVRCVKKYQELVDGLEFKLLRFEFALQKLDYELNEDKLFKLSLNIYMAILKALFPDTDLPLFLVHTGRAYSEVNFYHSIGEYIDIIPVVIKEGTVELNRHVLALLDFVKQHNINFTSFLEGEYGDKYPSITQILSGLNFDIKNFPLFNYQGMYGNLNQAVFHPTDMEVDTEQLGLSSNITIMDNKLIINAACTNHKEKEVIQAVHMLIADSEQHIN